MMILYRDIIIIIIIIIIIRKNSAPQQIQPRSVVYSMIYHGHSGKYDVHVTVHR